MTQTHNAREQRRKSCTRERYHLLQVVTGFTLIDRQPQRDIKRNSRLINLVYIRNSKGHAMDCKKSKISEENACIYL